MFDFDSQRTMSLTELIVYYRALVWTQLCNIPLILSYLIRGNSFMGFKVGGLWNYSFHECSETDLHMDWILHSCKVSHPMGA